ncbi:MAG: hypothetical protein Alis3KO_14350 [Aliiglaciecola sp.]
MKTLSFVLLVTGSSTFCSPSFAQQNWYVKPYLGLSQLSDTNGNARVIDQIGGTANINTDSGFIAGIGVGYHYSNNFAVEIDWEYRSNDSQTTIDDSVTYEEGNYASSMFSINGIWSFNNFDRIKPYVGAGLLWAQEIDIDLETNGEELSYSGSSDTGFQGFVGLDYRVSERWLANVEVRYGSVTGIDLDGEDTTGNISDLDYQTTTLQFGVKYKF